MLSTAMYGAEALFRLRCASRGLLVADAINRADLLVTHQQRSVGQLRDIRGPAPELVAVVALIETGQKRRVLAFVPSALARTLTTSKPLGVERFHEPCAR